nr:unnamed protein product [Digitaria exilis]
MAPSSLLQIPERRKTEMPLTELSRNGFQETAPEEVDRYLPSQEALVYVVVVAAAAASPENAIEEGEVERAAGSGLSWEWSRDSRVRKRARARWGKEAAPWGQKGRGSSDGGEEVHRTTEGWDERRGRWPPGEKGGAHGMGRVHGPRGRGGASVRWVPPRNSRGWVGSRLRLGGPVRASRTGRADSSVLLLRRACCCCCLLLLRCVGFAFGTQAQEQGEVPSLPFRLVYIYP